MVKTLSLQEQVPLAPFTTLGVGGLARYFVEVASVEALTMALAFADSHQLPVFLLGGGSNLVFSDEGFPGLVLRIQITGREWKDVTSDTRHPTPDTLATVGAGEEWETLWGSVWRGGWRGTSV